LYITFFRFDDDMDNAGDDDFEEPDDNLVTFVILMICCYKSLILFL